MPIRHFPFAAIVLISLTMVATSPALAQGFGNGSVLVSPDGTIMRNIPEAGSVRTVVDLEGRILLLNDWNEVIGIQMTRQQYQREYGRVAARPEHQPLRPRYPDRRIFPDQLPSDDGFANRDDFYGDDFYGQNPGERSFDGRDFRGQSDRFPETPRASIERRDLNPSTASVPQQSQTPDHPGDNPDVTKPKTAAAKLNSDQVTALQVFLDRSGMSPGVIDGRMGSNVQKALDSWYEASGERLDPADTDTIMDRLARGDGMAFTTYEITSADAAGPYVASIPTDYGEKARLERLAFTSTREMLAEKFHMDEAYLQAINPGADFTRPGTIIKVAAPGAKRTGKITSIIADKTTKQVRGYDVNGKLLVAYPATIGSTDTPSPSGIVRIERIAHNPGYTYNPKINFKQGENDKVLQIPPGPNGPVGSTWIALSKPTYGIHGTPEPSKIGKTASHGCVRLTNWDANELAGLVQPGVTVIFKE